MFKLINNCYPKIVSCHRRKEPVVGTSLLYEDYVDMPLVEEQVVEERVSEEQVVEEQASLFDVARSREFDVGGSSQMNMGGSTHFCLGLGRKVKKVRQRKALVPGKRFSRLGRWFGLREKDIDSDPIEDSNVAPQTNKNAGTGSFIASQDNHNVTNATFAATQNVVDQIHLSAKQVQLSAEQDQPSADQNFADQQPQVIARPREWSYQLVLSLRVLPNFEDMFIVEVNASDVGIGAVLMQNGKLLSYFRQKLGPRMRLAATYQKELFAIVEAIYKWRQYLLGRHFTIRTDHRSFKELMQQENDTLDGLKVIHQKLERKEVLDGCQREQGIILFHDRYFIGVKSKSKELLLFEFHNTLMVGHSGVKKMLVGISALFYWKGMRKSIEVFICKCLVCEQTKYSTQAPAGLLQPLPTPLGVWEDVSMDFITGLLVYKGLSIILVSVDRFTKYAHFETLPASFKEPKVDEVFMDMVVKHHGIPKTIVSDRDLIFVSKFWKQLFEASRTKLNHSMAYHLQTDR
ncbi:ty3-gypsy retrotransposon protein [Tanacetum coccineum]